MTPLYEKVKHHILQKIAAGELRPTERVPSENELVKALKVSRMTANRALRELATAGVLVRIGGVGTFVAEPKSEGHLLEVSNIADEVRERGHAYQNRVVSHGKMADSGAITPMMKLRKNAPVFHTRIVHLENNKPIQLEDRYVNVREAPHYAGIDLQSNTPSQYLLANFPLKKVQHTVRAMMPESGIRKLLAMTNAIPCLVLERLTWSQDVPVSYAVLYHPADSYMLSETFAPP
ncbi:MAG: GntR family histidine utilization transcriptional repressor [Halioglobus sp.]|jgi:GntR family histidine utilization transcriptional repressor